ncbi:MAG TPA: response regulator [Nitrospira sp.]|nr:response regulator [Nitrospira sp.]
MTAGSDATPSTNTAYQHSAIVIMSTQLPSSSAALLIEPDPDLVRMFRELIAFAYHSAVPLDVVSSLHEGLTYLQTHRVPLILMNLSLPDNAGRSAVELVRQTAGSSAIIGFHHATDTTMLSNAIRAGAHEVLPVIPPTAETLRLSITNALIRATRLLTTTEPAPSTGVPPPLSAPLAKVVHDLNNCLTSINGFADILFARLPAEDPSRYCAAQIKQACTRAQDFVRQLPRMTNTSSSSQPPKPVDSAPAA